MEQVKVILYDDLHHADDGSLVEAAASHTLELDGRRVKLDLTDANFKTLESGLAAYLDAGSAWAGELVSRPSARKRSQPPKPDHLMRNQAIRYWAAWQGRQAETVVPTGYYYRARLRKDVDQWLREHHMTPGEFVARVESGQYPAQDSEPAS